jgi:hypothetical protein
VLFLEQGFGLEDTVWTHAAAGLKSNMRDIISVVTEFMADGVGLKSNIRVTQQHASWASTFLCMLPPWIMSKH